jgi:hypothetical protein
MQRSSIPTHLQRYIYSKARRNLAQLKASVTAPWIQNDVSPKTACQLTARLHRINRYDKICTGETAVLNSKESNRPQTKHRHPIPNAHMRIAHGKRRVGRIQTDRCLVRETLRHLPDTLFRHNMHIPQREMTKDSISNRDSSNTFTHSSHRTNTHVAQCHGEERTWLLPRKEALPRSIIVVLAPWRLIPV